MISSKYTIGPFLKGQMNTVFTALRRVMLGNLEGIAIIAVRIKGIEHEFSPMPNMKEDVMSILLNLKHLVLKGDVDRPKKIKIKVPKRGLFLANDIQLPDNISFVDPRQYIATVTNNRNLEMELIIAKGQDYIPSGRLAHLVPKNFMALDGIFMPVIKISFFTEFARSSSSLSVEVRILEICTNGSLLPEEALNSASEILKTTYDYLLYIDLPINHDFQQARSFSDFSIERLRLSNRASNCLRRANVMTIGKLITYSSNDILNFYSCGKRTLMEIKTKLKTSFSLDLPFS